MLYLSFFILAFVLHCTQKPEQQHTGKKKKKRSRTLLPSLSHGSNTITMVLPGPRGTVQYPIRAPSEHSQLTKIMEKSVALFFCCYQSVVHSQGFLLLLALPSTLSFLFSCPSCLPLPPLSISAPVLFSHLAMWKLIRAIQKVEGLLYPSKLHPYLLCFLLCSIHEPIQPFVRAVITEHA